MHSWSVARDGREVSGQVEGLVPQLPDGRGLPELPFEERPEREQASRPHPVRAHKGPAGLSHPGRSVWWTARTVRASKSACCSAAHSKNIVSCGPLTVVVSTRGTVRVCAPLP